MVFRKQDHLIYSLLENISNSRKYRHVSKELIVRIGEEELQAHQVLKIAIKETKKKLHQVVLAYKKGEIDFNNFTTRLESAYYSGDKGLIREICSEIMSLHVSTAERIPILENFYEEIFAFLPPVHSVLDIGCGLNPLAIPWMSLPEDCQYYAWDVFYDLEKFLNRTFFYLQVEGKASTIDFLSECLIPEVDVTFLLKSIPCFFQLNKDATIQSLRRIPSKCIVLSYPTTSIGGKRKGMSQNYETQFNNLAKIENWSFRKISFSTELVYVVLKDKN